MPDFGIHPHHTAEVPRADLVLVHGLLGDSKGTWTGKDDSNNPTYWPDWIKQIRSDVNIWLVDYESSLSAWLKPAMPLDQIAGTLIAHAHDQRLGGRPIHWVGHSMGGLVIKHILCKARLDPDWSSIAQAHTAVTFLGTPHHGADLANWRDYFSNFLQATDLILQGGSWSTAGRLLNSVREAVDGQKRQSHIEQLTKHNRDLGKLNEEFALWMRDAHQSGRLLSVRNYMESLPVLGAVTVVPNASVRLSNGIAKDLGVQEDHFSICKFASHKNSILTAIDASLRNICERHDAKIIANTGASNQAHIKLDENLLNHQAHHAIKCLQRATAYWIKLQASENLQNWLTAECLVSPDAFIRSLRKLSAENITGTMLELREIFKEVKNNLAESEVESAAAATVACFLYCACSTMEAKSKSMLIGLPKVEKSEAAHLLASLIALVMAGGRLELRHGGSTLPRGSGTYYVQSAGINEQFDFERQLYFDLLGSRRNLSESQKTGGLSFDERRELLVALDNLRGRGVRTKTMCFIIDGSVSSTGSIDVALTIGVPVFHAGAGVAEVIFGVDAVQIVTHLELLWGDVCAYHAPDGADPGFA